MSTKFNKIFDFINSNDDIKELNKINDIDKILIKLLENLDIKKLFTKLLDSVDVNKILNNIDIPKLYPKLLAFLNKYKNSKDGENPELTELFNIILENVDIEEIIKIFYPKQKYDIYDTKQILKYLKNILFYGCGLLVYSGITIFIYKKIF